MEIDQLKKNCFILCLMLLLFNFSGYVLLSSFGIQKEISVGELSEENAEAGKEHPKDVVLLEWADTILLPIDHQKNRQQCFEQESKLPSSVLEPNTPPPDLA